MSRALNIDAPEKQVAQICAKHNLPVSAIEALPSGGTRVVLMNANDAATLSKAFGNKVIAGQVKRVATRLMRG
jgi:hypothetical protein